MYVTTPTLLALLLRRFLRGLPALTASLSMGIGMLLLMGDEAPSETPLTAWQWLAIKGLGLALLLAGAVAAWRLGLLIDQPNSKR